MPKHRLFPKTIVNSSMSTSSNLGEYWCTPRIIKLNHNGIMEEYHGRKRGFIPIWLHEFTHHLQNLWSGNAGHDVFRWYLRELAAARVQRFAESALRLNHAWATPDESAVSSLRSIVRFIREANDFKW